MKSKQIYLLSYYAEEVEFIFDEVKLLKEKSIYHIEVFALGSLGN